MTAAAAPDLSVFILNRATELLKWGEPAGEISRLVTAIRGLVSLHEEAPCPIVEHAGACDGNNSCRTCVEEFPYPCITLRRLGATWAGHADYQQEWRA